MAEEIAKRRCRRCKNTHPETLYSSEIDGLCVYCKADDAEALPEPKENEESNTETEEVSVEEKAKAELALRFLPRKRLFPFL